jgi:ABC-type branched-subunit amino acid transport system substrate-binding protein
MKNKCRKVIAFFLVLMLIAVLCLSCGQKEEGERVVIKLGFMNDYTGPGAAAMLPITFAIDDLVRHINEEDPIPGVKVKLVTFDARFDPARDVPGYDWCKEQGANVIITPQHTTPDILKPFAERDKVPIFTWASTTNMLEPPGWVFCVGPTFYDLAMTLVRWLSEQWPDYETSIPKIGAFGWAVSNNVDAVRAIKDFCQAHPNLFEYVAEAIVPAGTTAYPRSAIEKLKGCDYVFTSDVNAGSVSFLTDFLGRGYRTTWVSTESFASGRGLYLDAVGWKGLDGTLTLHTTRWWNEPTPIVELAEELVHKYRPEKAKNLIHQGLSYVGSFHGMYCFLEILRQAIAEVGAENFDGQAFYDAATKFKAHYDGYPEWGYSETKRYLFSDVLAYKWSADAGDLVRISDWIPVGQ